jgi:hypothetical protein
MFFSVLNFIRCQHLAILKLACLIFFGNTLLFEHQRQYKIQRLSKITVKLLYTFYSIFELILDFLNFTILFKDP